MNLIIDTPRDGIRRITLNRPQALNAFTFDLLLELKDAVAEATRDKNCRALVITGSGRGFCAGVDLKTPGFDGFLADRDPIEGRIEWGEFVTDVLMSIRRSGLPIIAAVNGLAVGGGLSIALLADIRIAGESATFADAYIRNGLSGCELGTSFLLPRLLGAGRAMELMLTGRTVDAVEAERIGLVTQVVPDQELADTALDVAEQIAGHAPFAVSMTKQVAQANIDATTLEQAMLLEMRTQMLALHTSGCREARASIRERRAPQYTGFRTR